MTGYEGMFIEIIAGLALLVLVVFVLELISPTKSFKYRKYLANMFVSSKLRKLAKADNLDLVDEEKSFGSWAKKNRLKEIRDVDSKIVEQVNAEIDEVIEKTESNTKKPKATGGKAK